ncbi:Uncharacterised protein [Bordetella pertussis]|nr:Uncharacterised protein [Bordetella pertussis]
MSSRRLRRICGWRSRKRLTTGVNSRLIIGGMPTSSSPRCRSTASRTSASSWRMAPRMCRPRS